MQLFSKTLKKHLSPPQERPLHLITITGDPEQKAAWPPKKRIIFIMGRVHASEAPSSFILQGLIDFLSSNHSVAKDLRRHLIFKLVPVMNPDGVFLGNTMGNLLGQDLNRCWMEPNQFSQPTVYTIRKLIHALDKDPVNTLDMIIDVHSHISLLGLFIVGNSYSDVYRLSATFCLPFIPD
jgi:predicted deacylase